MVGITQKSSVLLFLLWSLKKNSVGYIDNLIFLVVLKVKISQIHNLWQPKKSNFFLRETEILAKLCLKSMVFFSCILCSFIYIFLNQIFTIVASSNTSKTKKLLKTKTKDNLNTASFYIKTFFKKHLELILKSKLLKLPFFIIATSKGCNYGFGLKSEIPQIFHFEC